MSGYKPYHLDLNNIKLNENNPSDDYQRLYFNSLLAENKQSVDLNIQNVDYKSNIVNTFNHPPWLGECESAKTKRWNNLSCFEYQLPDVIHDSSLNTPENSIDNTPFMVKGAIIRNGDISTKDNKPSNNINSNNIKKDNNEKLVVTKPKDYHNNDKAIYDLNIKTGHISLSNDQNLKSLTHSDTMSTTGTTQDTNSTLTKNQQFKLTKLNYNLHNNSKLINPNNCILWDKSSGFVFLTGIWRLYQDIMNGLGSMERSSTKNENIDSSSAQLQNQCKLELDYILNYAFYEPISWDSKQTRRSRKNSATINNTTTNNNKQSLSPPEETHYIDLHWNNISKDLKHLIITDFQNSLKEQYPNRDFDDLDLSTQILQRIRGGYIKIQGTWLPWKVAKLICTRFCFPIRWLLVPLFGPSFPKDCEDYYFNIMLPNMKYIKQNSIFNNNTDNKKSSSNKKRRHTYSNISSSTSPKTPKTKRKRHSTTNISPPISPTTTYDISPKSKNSNLNSIQTDHLVVPNIIRGRSKSDFGFINPNTQFNPTTSNGSNPSTLPPITSVFEQINPYDAPFLAAANNLVHVSSTQQPAPTRPRINSLPSVTTSNKYQEENISYPTITTLSNLATFYNTGGHRYSYPKSFIQPTTLTSSGPTDNMKINSSIIDSSSSNYTSLGISHSQSKEVNNGLTYQWSNSASDDKDSLPRSGESNFKENNKIVVESKRLKQSKIMKNVGR